MIEWNKIETEKVEINIYEFYLRLFFILSYSFSIFTSTV